MTYICLINLFKGMNIIIPMAGWGSRLRPHTLTIPKPMVKIAGKPIVQRLVEGLVKTIDDKVNEINFIIRKEFGKNIEDKLLNIAKNIGCKGIISYQELPEGTAHAIWCAKESLKDNVVVAFADTLFTTDFKIDKSCDGTVWVSKVEHPEQFGVVKLNKNNIITDFIEKPKKFVSDLAIIGIYHFKDGENLKNEIQYLLDNDIREKGEYQLTNVLENMKQKGLQFKPGEVAQWLDCGNKDACVHSNKRVLESVKNDELLVHEKTLEQSILIAPCYIAKGVQIKNSIIGPHVSIGENTVIENCLIENSIIQEESSLKNQLLKKAMIGKKVVLHNTSKDCSIGDYTSIKNE